MEKLLELLNEYEGYIDNPTWTLSGANEPLYGGWTAYASSYLIPSKEYGFIKRLVQNDKISYNKIHKIGYIGGHDDYIGYDICCDVPRPNDYECLIMELSIEDNPIDYLCSILKE